MELQEFRDLILEVAEELPEKFRQKLENIGVVIDDVNIKKSKKNNNNIILGLYQGLPVTKRAGKRRVFPDKITIYKKAIESVSANEKQMKKNIKRVILHEIGHYFGLDDDSLKNLGY